MSHKLDKKFLKLHKRAGGTEGGACLTRHISGVTTSSCSHRWQARERAANDDSRWYNGKKAGWDVTGANFSESSRKPYWHQAHHIIPNAVLNNCIEEAAKGANSRSLFLLLRSGLLQATYNLNHKTNMVILPMEPWASSILELPRHLNKGERSHANYSAMVEGMLQPVIDGYAELIHESQQKEDHRDPPDKLSKAKLERASQALRVTIRMWGLAGQGASLEDHAPARRQGGGP